MNKLFISTSKSEFLFCSRSKSGYSHNNRHASLISNASSVFEGGSASDLLLQQQSNSNEIQADKRVTLLQQLNPTPKFLGIPSASYTKNGSLVSHERGSALSNVSEKWQDPADLDNGDSAANLANIEAEKLEQQNVAKEACNAMPDPVRRPKQTSFLVSDSSSSLSSSEISPRESELSKNVEGVVPSSSDDTV